LVFIDGSGLRAEPRSRTGLAPKGQMAKTTAKKPEKYEPRVDIMGAINYDMPLACETKTSSQRKSTKNKKTGKKGVKGYTKEMVKKFLKNKLAPKIQTMKARKVIVCMDKGLAFKEDEAKEQLRLGGAQNVDKIWILPKDAAKYVSPLDNTLWHSLKDRVRARKPKSEPATARIINEEFMGISKTDIHNYFKNCKLNRGSDASEDLV
jgi:hypothetical protein